MNTKVEAVRNVVPKKHHKRNKKYPNKNFKVLKESISLILVIYF